MYGLFLPVNEFAMELLNQEIRISHTSSEGKAVPRAHDSHEDLHDIHDDDFRDSIATVDEEGKRVWLYPKKPAGYFYNLRKIVSGVLLAMLFFAPFVSINGLPLLMVNVFEREFVILGNIFFPQDFVLVAVGLLTFFVFIMLFTSVFGRLWCGWACPQTLFMEMVFRPIEYFFEGDAPAQRRLDARSLDFDKAWRKTGKHLVYLAISVSIAHLVMAYIMGYRQALSLISDGPQAHPAAFGALTAFTLIFYVVFAKAREQVCVAICPYGRLQSVLLIKDSIVVIYDYLRGEPRGKLKKEKPTSKPVVENAKGCSNGNCGGGTCESSAASNKDNATVQPVAADTFIALPVLGDCIDCNLCVSVCPTGIDIRHGTQLECINCTACIDACDAVMDKISRPRGLIRLDSEARIAGAKTKRFNLRTLAYIVILTALVGLEAGMIALRSPVEATVLRVPGMMYQTTPSGNITNLYNARLVNKTNRNLHLTPVLKNLKGKINRIGSEQVLKKGETADLTFFVEINPRDLNGHKNKLEIDFVENGITQARAKTNFMGPFNTAAAPVK